MVEDVVVGMGEKLGLMDVGRMGVERRNDTVTHDTVGN